MRILRLSTPQARADALAAARPSCERRDVRLNDLFPIGPLPRGPFWWGRLGGEASAIYIYIFTFGSNGMYCTLLSTNGPLDLLGGCTTYPCPRYYMQFHIKPQHGGRRRQIYGERPSSRAAALRAWHWTRYCCVISLSPPHQPRCSSSSPLSCSPPRHRATCCLGCRWPTAPAWSSTRASRRRVLEHLSRVTASR
jgi:hypothetical protein